MHPHRQKHTLLFILNVLKQLCLNLSLVCVIQLCANFVLFIHIVISPTLKTKLPLPLSHAHTHTNAGTRPIPAPCAEHKRPILCLDGHITVKVSHCHTVRLMMMQYNMVVMTDVYPDNRQIYKNNCFCGCKTISTPKSELAQFFLIILCIVFFERISYVTWKQLIKDTQQLSKSFVSL